MVAVPAPKPLLEASGVAETEAENAAPVNPFAKAPASSSVTKSSQKRESCTATKGKSFFDDDDFGKPSFTKSALDSTPAPETAASKDTSGVSNLATDRSMLTAVTIESGLPLDAWYSELSRPDCLLRSMQTSSADNVTLYYRYPDHTLPQHQKKMIHKALGFNHRSSKPNETLTWYRQFSENWRKALLSVFETLKFGHVPYFYFVQEDMTVLFERGTGASTIRALLKLSSLALAEDFKTNGSRAAALKCLIALL